ncbi:MAG: SOS response-associated peptidase, partial [Chloroflexi bacterium]
MCGRFSLTTDLNKLQQSFNLDEVPPVFAPRYNIAPSQPVAVIANDNPKKLTFFKWGLVPSWAKDPRIGSKMINARAETLEEKPSFRTAFKRRRCLIPADGFFEWAKRNGDKVP